MANLDQITVDRAYFDALLRRADFLTCSSTSTDGITGDNPGFVSVSRVEYDSLILAFNQFASLKEALFSGGISEETLAILTAGTGTNGQRKDSAFPVNEWSPDPKDEPRFKYMQPYVEGKSCQASQANYKGSTLPLHSMLGNGFHKNANDEVQHPLEELPVPFHHHHDAHAKNELPRESNFENEDDDLYEGTNAMFDASNPHNDKPMHTLFFTGFAERTTYKDLISVIKGGKIVNFNLRSDRTATVTFLDGAAEFLAWAKRNDIYLHLKRIEVKWGERQYRVTQHIQNKALSGASRNIIVQNAASRGMTEDSIRADLDHIHNLVVVDVTFRGADAYISTNSIHNALFARTCMMSRKLYKGCKIDFFRDECDAPLPARQTQSRSSYQEPVKPKPIGNRFSMLGLHDVDFGSDEENQPPSDFDIST